MAACTLDHDASVEPSSPRNIVLRTMDVLAEWQMRQSLRVMNRGQVRDQLAADNIATRQTD
jgi:hypothetical protein